MAGGKAWKAQRAAPRYHLKGVNAAGEAGSGRYRGQGAQVGEERDGG